MLHVGASCSLTCARRSHKHLPADYIVLCCVGVQVLKVCVAVSRGMDYLHQRKIIHRDLKAANLLLDENGTVSRKLVKCD